MSDTLLAPLEWHNEKRKVKDLVPYEYNPRIITPEKLEKLKASLEKFNLAEVPAVNTDNVIIAGHQRVKVLMALDRGEELIDVRIPNRTLTEQEYKEYNITSNISTGYWDLDVLDEVFNDVDLMDMGLNVDEIVIPEGLIPEVIEAKEDDFDVPDGGIETDIVLGDLFEIGNHKLLCGSSTEEEEWQKLFINENADMILTDPPYNVDYEGGTGMKIMNDKMANNAFYQFLFDAFTAAFTITKAGGSWYVWHADSEGVNFRNAFQNSGIMLKQCLIWVKNALVMGRQDYQWKHEPCLYGWKPGAAHYFINERNHTTTIDNPIDLNKLKKKELLSILKEANDTSIIRCEKPTKNDLHPTMKPILLLAPLIKNSSRENEIIADGFAGSGSTMVASHQLIRRCYAIELDPKYCQVIIDRMIKLDPSIKIKKNGIKYNKELV